MEQFIVINTDTAEVEFFSSKKQAEDFVTGNEIIMPCVEVADKEEVELIIYPNTDKNSIFGSVAEYKGEVYTSDFIEAPDVPVKYMQAYEYFE